MTAGDERPAVEEWPRSASRLGARLGPLATDITPLRECPPYRRLWLGQSVSVIGTSMTAVAVPVQVFALTHSSFDVGLLGLAALLPLIVFGLLGGSIVDAVERRQLTLLTSTGLAALSLVLVAQQLLELRWAWLLYVVVGLQAALFAVDSPARQTFAPRLLPVKQLPAASALYQVSFNVGQTLGPVVAGAIIAASSVAVAYGVDAVSFGAALVAIARLEPMLPEGGGTRAGLSSVLAGLAFLRTRPVLLMTFVVDIVAMVAASPRALFPAFGEKVFGGGAQVVGLLYAAPAAGALVGALVGGWFGRVHRQGLAVLVSVAVWGAAITGFGLSGTLWLGLLMLAVAGGADMVSAVFRNTILQVATPDAFRGRLSGVYTVVVAGGPRLGDVESGAVAAFSSPTVSVLSGGLACLVGVALIAVAAPVFRRYDPGHPT